MEGFAIDNTEKRTCAEIHAQIEGYVSVEWERYLNQGRRLQPYQCGACGKTYTTPDDFRAERET